MHTESYLLDKRAIAVLASAITLMVARPLAAQVDLGLAPMRVEFPAIPGRPYSGSLVLSNAGAGKGRIRAELLDMFLDESMTPQFVTNAPAEADYSCRSWLSVNPMEMEIDPRSQTPVRFTVRVPENASERSFHCAIGFRTMPAADEQNGMAIRTSVRIIAAFYPVVGKPQSRGELTELRLEPITVPPGSEPLWRAVIVMKNSGFMLFRPSGDVDILDQAGAVVQSEKLPSFPVLPQRQQRFLLPAARNLAVGQYTIRARLDVGNEVQEASTIVTAALPPVAADPAPTPAK